MSKRLWMIIKGFYPPLLLLFGLFSLPHLLLRLRQAPDKRKLLRERFGFIENHFGEKKVMWLHAVSVGEVMAAREFIRLFQEKHPDWLVALSTTTPTGQSVAGKLENENLRVFYFPFDFANAIERVLTVIRPKLIVIMETEIWPNLIERARKRGIPIGVVNGRLSARAFKRYGWFRPWFFELFRELSYCLACTEEDRNRFVSMGIPEAQVQVTGNMKFDFENTSNLSEAEALRKEWGFERCPVLIGGSTHESEEEILIRVFQKLRAIHSSLKLVLAPRHPERAPKILNLLVQAGFSASFVIKKGIKKPDAVVLNVVGELSQYYALADIVFVGGSLIPHGGQNPIEPARERKAILHGPFVFNFQDLYKRLDESGAAVLVQDESLLYERAAALLKNPEEIKKMGSRAFAVVDQLRGATVRNLAALEPWLKN